MWSQQTTAAVAFPQKELGGTTSSLLIVHKMNVTPIPLTETNKSIGIRNSEVTAAKV